MALLDKKLRLGDALIESKLITPDQLQSALNKQLEGGGKKLGQILVGEGFITQDQLVSVLESHFGVQSVDLASIKIDIELAKLIPENMARRHNVIPYKSEGTELYLAMSDPLDRMAMMDVSTVSHRTVKPVLATPDAIKAAIDMAFNQSKANLAADDYIKNVGLSGIDDSNLDIDSAPIVRLVQSLIENGVRTRASDIHIEPEADKMRVRMRIDGVMQETMVTSNKPHSALVSRIKIMANLNISEKRLPQDGRILAKVDGRDIDLRIATIPSTQGEKIVMRILDKASLVEGIHNLGFDALQAATFQSMANNPHGMIFITGPTGSGKTTTLYTLLSSLDKRQKNIMTVEDPVEFEIEGITQTQTNVRAGLTFASGLRAFMRADPDIIMVGEVRDEETADVAVNAALTGHLVLSTLHTNDAAGAIHRIVEMGIKPYIVASSLTGVVAQRLVRKICPRCKKEIAVPDEYKSVLGSDITKLYKGSGCDYCSNTGYKGRTGVFEVLNISKELRKLIIENATADELNDYAIKQGMVTMRESITAKVIDGITTMDEMMRVMKS